MLRGLAKLRADVLRENAPKLYRQLKASGELEKHCNQAARSVRQAVQNANRKGLNVANAQSDAERQYIYEITASPTPEP